MHEANRSPRIGLFTGTTGPTAAWGEAIRRGAELAIDHAHARGASVDLLIEDDQGKPEQSADVVQRFISGDKVLAIVGGDTSGRSLAAAPLCERAGVAMVSPTASAPQLTLGRNFVFRICATDDLEARAVAALARERLRAARVAILRDSRSDYSVGLARVFTEAFVRAGGKVVQVFDYAEGDSDFRSQLTAIRSLDVDTLVVPGYYGDVAQIASQARDLGMTLPLIGGSGWDSPKLTDLGGGSTNGCWFVSGMRSGSQKFVAAFKQRYGAAPDAANAQAYDAVSLVIAAIERAGVAATPRAVRDTIATTRDFPGVSGTITIGSDGNARKPLGVFRVDGGKFVEVGSVSP